MLRKIIFWLHLLCGVIAGVVIGVMSFTGAALAFQKEISLWADRDVLRVAPPTTDAKRLPVAELLRKVRDERPDTRVSALFVDKDPTVAVVLNTGDRGGATVPGAASGLLYINPYTGEIREGHATEVQTFFRTMNAWHRWLGVEGTHRNLARGATGACNVAFLGLALTGLYLWWPRSWTRGTVRAVALFNFRLRGKARDFNWHNVIGLWSAPVLIVLTATAVPMSYRWANDALYRLTGSELPASGVPAGGNAAPVQVPTPAEGAKPLGYDALISTVQNQSPHWEQIALRFGGPGGRGGAGAPRGSSPAREGAGGALAPAAASAKEGRPDSNPPAGAEPARAAPRGPQPVTITLKESNRWPRTATTTLSLDPYTGAVLKREGFADLSAGRRLRTWTRFLHTGEAIGGIGQFIAGLASLGGVALMYTGLALAWRRFFGRNRKSKTGAT